MKESVLEYYKNIYFLLVRCLRFFICKHLGSQLNWDPITEVVTHQSLVQVRPNTFNSWRMYALWFLLVYEDIAVNCTHCTCSATKAKFSPIKSFTQLSHTSHKKSYRMSVSFFLFCLCFVSIDNWFIYIDVGYVWSYYENLQIYDF